MKWENKGHELDYIGKTFADKKKIYIYGAGQEGRNLFYKLKFLDCVEGFIDANADKQRTGYLEKPVFSVEALCNKDKDYLIIVAAGPEIASRITYKLISNGYKEGEDFYYAGIFINTYLPIYAMYAHDKLVMRLYPQSMTERCTLRCLNCNQSTPYIKNPQHFSKEAFKADLDLFFRYVDYIYQADFVGGEPFTHPDLYDLMEYAAVHYRDKMGAMHIITNGTIQPSDEILQLALKYNIAMIITDYSITVPEVEGKVRAFIEKLEKYHVRYILNGDKYWKDYAIGRAKLEFSGEDDKIRHFDNCASPCRYMKDGKLYYCTSDALGQRAGLVPKDEQSYVDFKQLTREKRMEVLEFEYGYLEKGYLDTCTKCYGSWTFNTKNIPKGIQYKGTGTLTLEKRVEIND